MNVIQIPSKHVYALLVGINQYVDGVSSLEGCVPDVLRMREMLDSRVSSSFLHIQTLLNEQATRDAVIDGFRKHLSQARKDDVILFFFSGHGSQVRAPEEARDESVYNETLVCYDSRVGDVNQDLIDKELAYLLSELDPIGAHITVILDCCHSGTATRDTARKVKRIAAEWRERPFDTYSVIPPATRQAMRQRVIAAKAAGESLPFSPILTSNHIVLSACKPEQLANEHLFDDMDEPSGVFTYFLLRALSQSELPSYYDLWRNIDTRVQHVASAQNPFFEGAPNMLHQPFLGGAVRARPPIYRVTTIDSTKWIVDGGALHGFAVGPVEDPFRLALFPDTYTFPNTDGIQTILGANLEDSIGSAVVTKVYPGNSVVSLKALNGQPLNAKKGTQYQAIVVNRPLIPYRLSIQPSENADPAVVEQFRTLLRYANRVGTYPPTIDVQETDRISPTNVPAIVVLQVREAGTEEGSDFIVRITDIGLTLSRAVGNYPLVVSVAGVNNAALIKALQQLEHMGRWLQTLEITNDTQTTIPPDAVRLDIRRISVDDQEPTTENLIGEALRQPVEPIDRGDRLSQAVPVRVRLTNTTNTSYYVAILSLGDDFSVHPPHKYGQQFLLDPKSNNSVEWLVGVDIPQAILDQEVDEHRTVLKIFISTEPIDVALVSLEPLAFGLMSATRSTPLSINDPLSKLLAGINHTRSFEISRKRAADWTTTMVTLTAFKPKTPVILPQGAAAPLMLNKQVIIHPHPTLVATIRLGEEEILSTRSADSFAMSNVPPLFRDNPTLSKPYSLGGARDGSAGWNAIELYDIQNPEGVSRESPLRLTLPDTLDAAQDEHLLVYAQDPTINGFVVVGYVARDTEHKDGTLDVLIHALPSSSTRDRVTAAKILFRKLALRPLGAAYDHPRLERLQRHPDPTRHTVVRDLKNEPETLKALVQDAQKILLYIHGWTGDTHSMVSSAFFGNVANAPALADRYDLVLGFDYESIHTSIKETARDLKHKLEEIGLGANHGRQLHLVAHSMGGLVSRWFIEREGGNSVVQHLVMLGTPNGGIPWPKIQAMATYGASILLNTIGAADWVLHGIGALIGSIEAVDTTIDEMESNSEFYKTLNSSPNPNVPYTCIGGNARMLRGVPQAQSVKRRALEVLKLTGAKAYDVVRGIVFDDIENDLFIAVSSVHAIPSSYTPLPRKIQIDSNHFDYFVIESGMNALQDALDKV